MYEAAPVTHINFRRNGRRSCLIQDWSFCIPANSTQLRTSRPPESLSSCVYFYCLACAMSEVDISYHTQDNIIPLKEIFKISIEEHM